MFEDDEDRLLMLRVANRDSEAFELLYRKYERPIGNFLYRMCYDKALAEDCVQEVFMRIWRAAANWRGESKVSTFIFQIAKNYGLNARDKAAREKARMGGSHQGDSETENDAVAIAEPDDVSTEPHRQLVEVETSTLLRDAVNALPEEQRIIVYLAQIEGLTYREVSEILNVPVGTVKSRMASAVESLRWKLGKHIRS